ncbi:centrosomal protein of 290 kDa-like isoform X1 [Eriocheir sinensis]|uniref:centrosomal protein of 290 kDa-like isoform X1 n=1 Tax=Eriocheir sinensis TaxID=95602 RepID=UPI0021C6AB31|nr:centrosomal protein of 290 kDa-like isoform X1 [Eriocheir sinensis]XP_050702167.1 centrosomal protein of 290 kDa-like isoform X2 [Eriocheir sinensis]XP_050702168.1 centrosomal protein of 290 kDa-like isoform X3 [Eriocheir sinensis]XP_050702169.1 centrosomal protein of 290 kDa-like isoform X1 [Eriocheir sinensis]
MHVDWEYLRGVAEGAGDWEEAQLEELYQALVGITRLRRRDKTVDKLEMLFTLSQAVMMAKHTQASALEQELGSLAESAGRRDAKRERELQQEVKRLQAQLREGGTADREEEHIAYDWSTAWRLKKKEMEESLNRKNLEIQQFMDDLQSCEEERAALRVSAEELEGRLGEATREITDLTADYVQLKESHKHLQERLAAVQGEVEGQHCHVEELATEKARVQQRYDELSAAVDARVDQLEVVVRQREEELQKVKAQLHQCSMLSSGAQAQREAAKVVQLEKQLKEKDEEVSQLSEQLKEAAKEMDGSAHVITQLKKAKTPPGSGEGAVIGQLRLELSDARQQLQQMRTQLLAAEEDAQLHAQDLSTVIGELQSHLAGEFSLADAVRELKEVRSQVRMRDTQLTQLTGLVNTLQININDLLDENYQLREQLNLEPREDIDLPGVKKTNWQESKAIIERLTNQVNKLQDEKVALRTKMYEMTRELSNTRSSLQLTTIEMPKTTRAEVSSGQQLQSIEGQISHLSTAVSQLIQQRRQDSTDHNTQAQLETLQERCLRLEGEKASLERIIQNELKKKKSFEKSKEEPTRSPEERVSPEPPPTLEPTSRSPTAALDQLIKALGHLPPSAEEIIAKLKNQVTFLMQECSKREEGISEREQRVGIYTTQFEGLRVQVSDLNTLLAEEKQRWQAEKVEQEKTVAGLRGDVGALQAQREEMQAALDTLASGQPGVETKLTRRLAELRYDLEIAKRLQANQEEAITSLHQQLKERLEALQQSLLQVKQLRHEGEKEQGILKHRIYQLENELTQSVPRTAADQTGAQLAATTAKYRSLLQAQSRMMQEKSQGQELAAEKQQLLHEREQLCQKLESAREKVHSLQASLNLLGGNSVPVQPQVALLSRQLAAVELRELAEKQKAEHAAAMYQSIKGECEELHRRVQELEETAATTSKMNLSLQTTEAELRQRLQGAVLPQEYQSVARRVEELTEEKAQLTTSVQQLRAAVDVMETQARQRQLLEAVSRVEVEQLRHETQDLAAISDERSKIHQLHREITYLKVKNLELLHQVEEMKATEEKQSGEVFRLAQQLRDRERLHETSSDASRARATRLHLIIRDLRQQYAGAVPLSQQEQLVEVLDTMRQERNSLQEALLSAQHNKMESHITLRQLKVKQEALDDLKTALTSPKPSSHVSSWCTKLEEAKLRNVELEERLQMMEANESLHQKQMEKRERRITDLQTQLISVEKMWMDEQLVCDEREAELNEALARHERRHKEAVTNRSTLSLLDVPDATLPLPKQLEEALDCLRNKVSLLEVADKEMEKLKDENSALLKSLKVKEIEVIARDKVINELRLAGKSTRESMGQSDEKQDLRDVKVPGKVQPEDESVKVVIEGLKERLRLSQTTVTHYQNLLAKEHEERQVLMAKYKEELYHTTQRRDEAQAKVRELQSHLDSIPTHDFSSSALRQAQVAQIQNLEGTVKIVERQLEEARTHVNASDKRIMELERDLAISRREHAEEKDHLEVSGQVRIQQHQREVERLSGEMHKLRMDNDLMHKEMSALRTSASRTPSAIMRTLVEKLRDQLIDKEKQVAKLTLAVNDMKESIAREEEAKHEETNPVDVEKEISEVTKKLTESFTAQLDKVSAERDEMKKLYHEKDSILAELKEKTSTETEHLSQEVKALTTENLRLKKQTLQQKNASSTLRQRLEDLEGRSAGAIARAIESLQAKLERMEGTEEVQESEARKARSQEQVVRWEERKKLKVAMDKLKSRIKELETAHEDDSKKLTTCRDLLGRVEKEKLSLQHKFNNLSKVSTEKMCRVCLKTLNSVEMGSSPQTLPSPGHCSRAMRQAKVSPSPERPSPKRSAGRDAATPTPSHSQQSEQDENEIKFRLQLKKALEEKHSLESRLHSAVEEVAALRYRLQQKEEEEDRFMAEKKSPAGRRTTGAVVVLEYESRITNLEEQLRQKSRLLSHVKGVVQEAAAREETLLREKETLLQKLTLLEGISEDTPSARLVHELRQAKLTVTRLQRRLDELQPSA